MNKTYVVKEIMELGDFHVIGVCPTLELAEKLRQKNENLWELEDCEVSFKVWTQMQEEYFSNYSTLKDKSFIEAMVERHPEYPVSDIERADREFSTYNYVGTAIEEIDLYTNDSDITLYGIDRR